MSKVDIIIPVYKPTNKLFTLLDRLNGQTVKIHNIILINTEQKYFDILTAGTDFKDRYPNVMVKHISKKEFDHGNTRKQAVKDSKTPYFIMMTDDAVPADRSLVEQLLKPVEEGKAAMSYARQLTDENSGMIERYTREFNYPDQSIIKSKADLEEKGIKTFFASNVCAAYNREIYDTLGGFVEHTIFNEDMIYARRLIDKGYHIAYAASAKVYHSHNYSGLQQFHRNFDLGVSHAQYPDIFEGIKTTGEGMRLVTATAGNLVKQGKPWLVIKLFWQSFCKYAGFFLGKRYKMLPVKIVKACSMNKEYWK